MDLGGKQLQIWSSEQGIGRGRQPLSSLLNRFAPYTAGTQFTTYSAVPAVRCGERAGRPAFTKLQNHP